MPSAVAAAPATAASAPVKAAIAAAGAPSLAAVSPLPETATRAAPPANDTFVPFPSPLRDLGAEGARKTLVGITPPTLLQSIASAVGVKAAAAPPAAAAPARAAASSPPAARSTIEGAPCKPIETNEDFGAFDFGAFDGRRPTNPTVPLPRPRPTPRTTASIPAPFDETPDIGGRASWHGTTTRTLRFVFKSPDHKPQRVAALLVCAAAALVIFAVGRSPVGGTSGIGQATGALEPKGEPASAAAQPEPPGDALAKASGVDSSSEGDAPPTQVDDTRESGVEREPATLAGDELAPGLVLPPPPNAGTTRPAADISPGAGEQAAPRPRAAPKPPAAVAPAAKPPVKKAPPPPPPPTSLPPPARKNSTELDFGI